MSEARPAPETDVSKIALEDMDVSDPALYQDDCFYPYFKRLRQEDPVHYCAVSPFGPYWSITRFDDIMKVELDHQTFSSAAHLGGITIRDNPFGNEMASFITMDQPEHTEQRKTVAPAVAPSNLRNMEAMIRERTQHVLDSLPKGETFDWVDRVSIELTTMMLATLFDFPFEERRKLTYWSDVAVTNLEAPDALVRTDEERMVILQEMGAFIVNLWQQRTEGESGFDMISMMAQGEATKDMDHMDIIANFVLLIVGGNDTTRNSMSGGLLALMENPDQFAALRADPSLIKTLVPEIIRYQSAIIHMRRTALADTELNGKKISKGDRVVMWYVSGNWDDEAIDDPESFNIQRPKARRHLAFGAGIHRCVGDRLAELQLQILWEEILKRDLRFELMGPPERIYSNFIRGIRKMPVRIL
ncbi:MAG: cytochrome P450 [Proteobacteria bacterium]|nr:cytochrome P450 [Pseudomonadota bacterium]